MLYCISGNIVLSCVEVVEKIKIIIEVMLTTALLGVVTVKCIRAYTNLLLERLCPCIFKVEGALAA